MRTLLGPGAAGDIVREVQRTLTAAGFDTNGVDGDYGQATVAAVESFQVSKSLPVTGIVDDVCWQPLMQRPVPSVADRCVQLTSCFEGHGFGLAVGNFDGALITWGIIGFTMSSGEIQSIVLAVNQNDPDKIRQVFGPSASELLNLMTAPRDVQRQWADAHTVTGRQLAEPWRTMFANFGALPEVQQEQLKRVQRAYMQPAIQTASKLGLSSELGLALCFDIHVQNGGVKASAAAAIAQLRASRSSEEALRVKLANLVADSASPQWQGDVRERKMTVATGQGRVHGRNYSLESWGLSAQFQADEIVARPAAASSG